MKKIYIFTLALLALCLGSNAATKNLYSWRTLQTSDWTGHGNLTFNVVTDDQGSYYTMTNGGSGQRGAVNFWGDVIGEYTKYSIQLDYKIASYNDKDAGRYLGAEFSFLSADVDPTTFNAAANATQTANSVLDLLQKSGDAGVVPDWATNTFFVNGDQEKIALLPVGSWYTLYIDVDGTNVSYQVKEAGDTDGAAVISGTATVPEALSNKAIGLYVRLARAQGMLSLANLKITTEIDGAVANTPTVTLSQVLGNDRVYTATFADGEILHYILPGGEEQSIDYWTAADEDGNPGYATLTVTESGTLKAWTVAETDETIKSEEVSIDVTTGMIKLVDPVVSIASVSEGYGKTYKITFDNAAAQHLLAVKAAITYTIDNGETQEVSNGGIITMDKAGTLVVTVNQIPQGGKEYYDRSSVTIQNDVEYACVLDVQYINWDDSHFNLAKWTAGTLEDGNMSHWLGHWQEANRYDKSEQTKKSEDPSYEMIPTQNPVKVYRTDATDIALPIYTLTNDEAGVNYATELLPLIPNTARANVAILLEEGIFANNTSYNNLEITFDPQWVTDDASKPNFVEIRKTGDYDRYDKPDNKPGEERHITDIVETSSNYNLFRYDTAIHSARIFTYKGFQPTTGVEAIKTVKATEDAPIYNLSGVRVQNAAQKGIYIQNGKKFVVK
ncbi:MAG: hypothetical protein IJ647_07945 [Prevotella sp.]|nr:hypothetical protein [Prevotella sp.]